MATKKRRPYGSVAQLVAEAQQAGCTTAREMAEHSGLTYMQCYNALMRAKGRPEPGPPTTKATQVPEVPEVPARVGKSSVVRLDSALLAALKEKARREGRLVVEVLNRAVERYLLSRGG